MINLIKLSGILLHHQLKDIEYDNGDGMVCQTNTTMYASSEVTERLRVISVTPASLVVRRIPHYESREYFYLSRQYRM